MKLSHLAPLLLTTSLFCSALPSALAEDSPMVAVEKTIDAFHAAAARGDKTTYLGLMTTDGVFLGTDEWERWPRRPDFNEYVNVRFQNGKGWNYRSVERNIDFAPDGNAAWFDEVTVSESNGRFRGTGVLVKETEGWKIAHYAMSFLILNENWDEVVKLTQETRQAMAAKTDLQPKTQTAAEPDAEGNPATNP